MTDLRRLSRESGARRDRRAARLLEQGTTWEAWHARFRDLHFASPEDEAVAAAALSRAARGRGERPLAARFLLLHARALHRSGSAPEALRAYEGAVRGLVSAGLGSEAAAARVMQVDALAIAGRPREALRMSARAAAGISGKNARAWRTILQGNRANALRLLGDLDGAVRTYGAVERAFRAQGNTYAASVASLNLGVALLDAGDAERARARFAAAAEALGAGGYGDVALEARYNLACADVRIDRLGAGVLRLEALAKEHDARGLLRRGALCRMDLADALRRAGDRAASEQEALRAAEGFREAGAEAERAEALLCAAAAAPGTSRARAHLRRARTAAIRSGREGLCLRCDVLEGGRPLGRLIRRATALGQEDVRLAAVLLEAQRRPAATARLLSDPGFRRPGRPWARASADTLLARVEASQGRTRAALARLERTSRFLGAVQAGLPGAWLQAAFLVERMDPTLELVDLLLERGSPGDRRRALTLLDGVAARRFLEAGRSRPGETPALAKVRRRLEAIYDRLAAAPGSDRGAAATAIPALEQKARLLEREATRIWSVAERTSMPKAAGELGARSAGAVHVWVHEGRLRGLGEHAADLGSVEELEERLDSLRFHARRGAHPEVVGSLTSLRRDLWDPLGARGSALIVDPRAPDVPWEHLVASVDGAAPVVRIPSSRARPRARPGGRGVRAFVVGETSLPGARVEAQAAAGAGTVLSDAGATRGALRDALSTARVVHVAGHGFDAPEAAPLGGVRLHDGWFTSADVPDVVRADLVVLAACRSGRAEGRSALAWGGLPTTLLAAGARFVVWTADDVDDQASAALLTRLHRARRRNGVVAAFGAALAATTAHLGSPSLLLPFRLSGLPPC